MKQALAILGVATLVLAGCQDRNAQAPAASASAPPAQSVTVTTPLPPAPPGSASAVTPATPGIASATAPVPASASSGPASWSGKWTGPEGTSLTLTLNGDRYDIVIRSLDGPATYAGTAVGDHIEFMRNGPESIRAGNGRDTGMKWLLDKSDCLYIKAGEGFCKD
ncbi:MAG: hypothetical protein EOO28_26515 [Comamonadaceae bacterium]|nr:MAG: hypothetical protein EOO28_26515 [Comamonadaceae bacterium]